MILTFAFVMTTLYAPLPTLNLIVENYDIFFFQIVWSKQYQTSTESPPLLAFCQWMLKSFHSFIETSLKKEIQSLDYIYSQLYSKNPKSSRFVLNQKSMKEITLLDILCLWTKSE